MKIKHKESGKIIELVEGTLYPTQLYDLVARRLKKRLKLLLITM